MTLENLLTLTPESTWDISYFFQVYRHEGRRPMRHELRCHAVLCTTASAAKRLEQELKQALEMALLEFKKDKLAKQNARLSLVRTCF